MKLDLINSRFGVTSGPRVYDSIEGEFIQHAQPSPKTISKAAFKNKQKRLDFEPRKEFVPDRFNVSVVDRCGSYIPADKTKRFKPKQSLPRVVGISSPNDNSSIPPNDPFLLDTYPSHIVDYKKDRIYFVKEDSVQNRIASGRLPGAAWDVCGRKQSPPGSKLGPGEYEVYDSDLTNKGRMQLRGGQFTTGLAREEEFDPEFLPLKERQRYQRVKTLQDAKQERLGRALSPLQLHGDSVSTLDNTAGSLAVASATDGPHLRTSKSTPGHIGGGSLGGYGKKDRFDDLMYKQESFVKTSGMTLSGDWDKHLVKKIPFSFQPPAHKSKKSIRKPDAHKSEGADVDVDVGHMFSIVHAAAKSPVKYSAAFRSSAKVGMDIPEPTSGVNIGPGSFPGAHTTSLVVKQPDRPSHFILRGRPHKVRRPLPDLTEPQLAFAERHKSGPIFDKHVVSGGNVVLAAIVKERMTKIYPKLAEKTFPEPPPLVVPSPWKPVKRK